VDFLAKYPYYIKVTVPVGETAQYIALGRGEGVYI
jgi:hypothetical protein